MGRNRERRRADRYRNHRGETIERVRSVLRLECPKGCTEVTIAVFVESRLNPIACPNCLTQMPLGTGVWGQMGSVFVPDAVVLRERSDALSGVANDEDDEPTRAR